jgi:deoxycytidine triphosphate deaminase
MAYLTGKEIVRRVEAGQLEIDPFDPKFAGPNSYDLHMGDTLMRYARLGEGAEERLYKVWTADDGGLIREFRGQRASVGSYGGAIDSRFPPDLVEVPLIEAGDCEGGWLLKPGVLYIGRTRERTFSPDCAPAIAGRSSLGRLGVFCHVTAGLGDVGFNGTWTLELAVVEPVILYPGGRYFQVTFSTALGEVAPYAGRYQNQVEPTASKIHL